MSEEPKKIDIKGKGRAIEDLIPDIDDEEDDVDFQDLSSSGESDDSDDSMQEDYDDIHDEEPEDYSAIDPTNIMCSTRTRRKKIDFTKVLEEGQNEDDFEEEDEDYIPPQDKTM
ncbi:Histone H2A.Z-specific chaperone chz1 [Schizosaccharomyces pombe]|uniref:Histone H2A.Z-specific chaperone chz1 n=1 Tax=Schizosaccharomyces pombe (strain 972 / ATCC 24843) TaxID=284812 RepID=CHZ1_SCHPO|nr:putative histone chaperone Chz1 [Schizosaccharomyces pombe]Q10239.1 RecName: Full=Histone H2A.Z-specific chaperone chz1 [Schizosaccharomyces pombe 972h-]CAA93556.1 histone chaperone Chz1 (predicted) [Schizosaccharomyces pombe]|eukprot:NP_593688.1 putative histone chaperone Chz1 [Schizosaccharomyces pombe]